MAMVADPGSAQDELPNDEFFREGRRWVLRILLWLGAFLATSSQFHDRSEFQRTIERLRTLQMAEAEWYPTQARRLNEHLEAVYADSLRRLLVADLQLIFPRVRAEILVRKGAIDKSLAPATVRDSQPSVAEMIALLGDDERKGFLLLPPRLSILRLLRLPSAQTRNVVFEVVSATAVSEGPITTRRGRFVVYARDTDIPAAREDTAEVELLESEVRTASPKIAYRNQSTTTGNGEFFLSADWLRLRDAPYFSLFAAERPEVAMATVRGLQSSGAMDVATSDFHLLSTRILEWSGVVLIALVCGLAVVLFRIGTLTDEALRRHARRTTWLAFSPSPVGEIALLGLFCGILSYFFAFVAMSFRTNEIGSDITNLLAGGACLVVGSASLLELARVRVRLKYPTLILDLLLGTWIDRALIQVTAFLRPWHEAADASSGSIDTEGK